MRMCRYRGTRPIGIGAFQNIICLTCAPPRPSEWKTPNILINYHIILHYNYQYFSFISFWYILWSWSRALRVYYFFFIKLRLISISLSNWKLFHHCTAVDPEHYYLLDYDYTTLYVYSWSSTLSNEFNKLDMVNKIKTYIWIFHYEVNTSFLRRNRNFFNR